MNVQAYLSRIHLLDASTPGYEFLAQLQRCHMETVPFENLDVLGKREIVLDEDRLFQKVVREKRGGFCYELNGAFGTLLRALGFPVTRVSARVYNTKGDPGPEFDHMALLVDLDRRYLVDVGFGDSALTPLPLPDGRQADSSGQYRLVPAEAGRLILQRKHPDGWRAEYDFTETPRMLADYGPMCAYHQTSADSPFTQRPVCTRATAKGRITLSPSALTITENGSSRKLPVASPPAFYALLESYFDISLPPALQERIERCVHP